MQKFQWNLSISASARPHEIVEITQRKIHYFFLLVGLVIITFGVTLRGIGDAQNIGLRLARIHREQVQNFDSLSTKYSLLFTLEARKAISTVSAIERESKEILESIYKLEDEALTTLEQLNFITRVFFPDDITAKMFTTDKAEMDALERIKKVTGDRSVLQGIANVVYLLPIETSLIQRKPWSNRFALRSTIINKSLRDLTKLETNALVTGFTILVILMAAAHFLIYRPSFLYLYRMMEDQERALEFRNGLITFIKALPAVSGDVQMTTSNVVKDLNVLVGQNPAIKGTRFKVVDVKDIDHSRTGIDVISSLPVSAYKHEILVAELTENSQALREDSLPYLDVLSQYLRLQSEFRLRHRAESDRDILLQLSWSILENLPNPVFILQNGKVTMANPEACTFFKVKHTAMLNKTIAEISAIHLAVNTPIEPGHTFETLGGCQNSTCLFHYQDGRSFEWRKIVVHDLDEIYMGQDFTELLSSVAAQEQKRKLEMLGKISGTIAHDTNNFLAVIQSTLELVGLEPKIKPETHELLVTALRSCENAVHLNRKLVSYSQKQDLVPKRLNLSSIIPEVIAFLTSSYSELSLDVNIPVDPPMVIDRAYLTSAIINIVKNGAEAMGGQGTLYLNTKVMDNGYLRIRIEDQGPGFTSAGLKEALQPFFSEGKYGTGLGLSSVDGFARQSGGWVELSNRKGACVDLFFPIHKLEIDNEQEMDERHSMKPPLKNKQILLVEDNIDLAKLLQIYFKTKQFEVHIARDLHSGLELLEKSDIAYDIIISDISLPDGSGADVGQRSFDLGKHLPVILMTGYGGDALENTAITFDYEFVQKPFIMSNLGALVDQLT